MSVSQHRNSLRSYAVRAPKLSPQRQEFLQAEWRRYGLMLPSAPPLDLELVFARHANRILEIGFGNGDALTAMAHANPETDFLGIEVYPRGIVQCLEKARGLELANLRLIQGDALELLPQWFAEHSLAGINVFFPDPWPKSRHHKRRLIRPGFIEAALRALAPGGVLHVATDWQDYAKSIIKLLAGYAGLERITPPQGDSQNQVDDRSAVQQRPTTRPATRYEARGQRLGHRIVDLRYRRLPPALTASINPADATPARRPALVQTRSTWGA